MALLARMTESDQAAEIIANLNTARPLAVRERRQRHRVPFRAALEATLLHGAAEVPLRLSTRNLSRAGLSFVVRRALVPGMRLVVPLVVKGQPGKLVLLRTTSCRYVRKGCYEAGGEFVQAVPATDPPCIPPAWLMLS